MFTISVDCLDHTVTFILNYYAELHLCSLCLFTYGLFTYGCLLTVYLWSLILELINGYFTVLQYDGEATAWPSLAKCTGGEE